jgi:hypothetical protein
MAAKGWFMRRLIMTDTSLLRAGCIALSTFLLMHSAFAAEPYEAITDKQINEMTFDDVEEDRGFEIPFARSFENLDDDGKKRLNEFIDKFDDWAPGKEANIGQRVRNFICALAIVDAGHGEFESEAPLALFDKLKGNIPKDKFLKAAAWVTLKPEEGTVVKTAKDLGFELDFDEAEIRGRSAVYAKKIVGRLLGKLPPKEQ